jgi:biotin carboxyl carrier protein
MVRLSVVSYSIVALTCLPMLAAAATAQEIVRIPAQEAQLQLIRAIPISTEVTGALTYVNPTQEGQLVKKDDVLIKVNDAVIRAEVAHATTQAEQTTEIDFALKSRASVEQRLKTMEDANKREAKAWNANEMRQATLEVDKAQAQVRKSEDDKILYGLTAEIKKATLDQYAVKAPFDGMVTIVHRYPGQNVRPGDPVLTITDMSELRAALQVNFKHRDLLFVGDKVEIRIDTSERRDASQAAPEESGTKSLPVDIFKKNGPNAEAAPSPAESDEPGPDVDADGPVFIGEIKFIEPDIESRNLTSFVKLSVLVPNHLDKYGRYMLQEGMPVKAVILARKRTE